MTPSCLSLTDFSDLKRRRIRRLSVDSTELDVLRLTNSVDTFYKKCYN